ncbi:3-ketosteroid-9-alpha-hydroxylase oxygenase subunit [Nocardioides psychrotolerans]|uniref:Rieske-type oxygenase n=1 Tax=Nocardioides psychrotolerans TaxID=1005945 RepID=A0A1I3J768_9ACTN|nr:Rieske 2Fe-2S domain-containing protein [Nocardioides psychrotolerans]GEP38247.1 3-ketosteroid-9-alpha-hydroxylase oxygenase subunit [Nocardioides psychrotolerans]SFI56154.1 3-ketosteroid 9alpha-monooxygenase subunit A [Nocardioides psychrotolerans]
MSDTRFLDQGAPPERFARGWHCLGLAKDFADGKPHGIDGFGGKLVVWQDTQGNLNVLDGYCRHMGGDLTQGAVKGDEIACPFHDWRWGGDGKCKAIPYARRVPLRARTQKYPAVVRNGQLMVWHDVEGSEADHDVLPPELAGVGTEAYTDWTWEVLDVPSAHCREIIDNVVDMAHFFYIHFAFPTNFRNVFEGHVATQFMESTGRPDMDGAGYGDEGLVLKSEASYFGPSYMINWLHVDYKGFETEVILINCHVPTGPNSFKLQYALCVKKPEGVDDATADYIGKRYSETFKEGFEQDVHIWLNKAPVQNPLLCEEDGPVYQLRRWYEQFYVDKADVTPEMTDRFEFEVDTTKANEYWREEVARNLAKKAEEDAATPETADA